LVLSAGADLRYGVVDVPEAVAREVLTAWRSGRVDRAVLSPRGREVVDQLATAGALRVEPGGHGAGARVATVFVGEAVEGFGGGSPDGPGAPGVVVLVRTTGSLAELASRAGLETGPHLVVDVAYHHTVVLGPMVVPGQTACAGCLVGRMAARWGDDHPPPAPAASRAPVAAAIVAHEAAKAADGTTALVNRTVAVDLGNWRTVDEALLRLPWCRWCGTGPGDGEGDGGRTDLSWAVAER
jgi:hypothetical protein